MSEIDTAEVREIARREIARTHGNHQLAGYAIAAADEIDRLRAQLPDGMKDCTIQFKQCKLGHGWLTATNWVQHGCLHCEFDAFKKRIYECLDGDSPMFDIARLLNDGRWLENCESRFATARVAALEKAIQIADKAVSIQRHFGTKEAADACEDVANQLRDLSNSPTCEAVE